MSSPVPSLVVFMSRFCSRKKKWFESSQSNGWTRITVFLYIYFFVKKNLETRFILVNLIASIQPLFSSYHVFCHWHWVKKKQKPKKSQVQTRKLRVIVFFFSVANGRKRIWDVNPLCNTVKLVVTVETTVQRGSMQLKTERRRKKLQLREFTYRV